MEDLNTTVRVSGFVLGSLMFQHFNSDSDVEGFILGESRAEERSNITDSQIDHIHFEHTINIQKHIPCRKLSSFYSNEGEVKKEEIWKILLKYKKENVIGWYKQRRNTDQQITFKEQVVHRNLKRALSNHELIFLLLTPTKATSSGSTHRLEYSVHMSHGSRFHSLPVLVSNLGMLEQQDYWRLSASCSSVNYSRAINKHGSRFFSSEGLLREVEEVKDMNESLQAELKTACQEVEGSERLVEALLADVYTLRKKISEKRRQQKERDAVAWSPEQPADSQESVLLCEALRALFPGSALMRTRALTLQGIPVPEFCCSRDHGIDISTTLPLVLSHKPPRGRRGRPWGKRGLAEPVQRPKRRRTTLGESVDSPSLSESEEEESGPPQNGDLEMRNSPVF